MEECFPPRIPDDVSYTSAPILETWGQAFWYELAPEMELMKTKIKTGKFSTSKKVSTTVDFNINEWFCILMEAKMKLNKLTKL